MTVSSDEWDKINDEFQKMIDAAPDDIKEEISSYLMDSLHTLLEWNRGIRRIPTITRLSTETIEFVKTYLNVEKITTMYEMILTINPL